MNKETNVSNEHVTRDLCDAKHSELLRALRHVEVKIDTLTKLMHGNGRPGLRQTQDDVERLKRDAESQKSWAMFFLRPLLPLMYGALFAGALYAIGSI